MMTLAPWERRSFAPSPRFQNRTRDNNVVRIARTKLNLCPPPNNLRTSWPVCADLPTSPSKGVSSLLDLGGSLLGKAMAQTHTQRPFTQWCLDCDRMILMLD